jgi:SAM-dependent methyltransferase
MNNSQELKCRICKNTLNNNPLTLTELHVGTYEKFNYFECNECKCIQICAIPDNLSSFYPSNYYSFSFPKKSTNLIVQFLTKSIKKNLVKYYCGNFSLIGFIFSLFYSNPFPWLTKEILNFNSKILDVGTGAGRLLYSMQRSGFKNLTGIDPFIESDIIDHKGVNIYKKDVFQVQGKFDIIMLHHSFEHMDDPIQIIKKLKTLLSETGIIIIRIPTTGGYAWRKYRESWVQLDAPRHFYIHSIKSMQILAKNAELEIDQILFDSSILQFIGSEKYLLGIPLMSNKLEFSKKQIKQFKKEAQRLNKLNDGDAACFYLKTGEQLSNKLN